MQTLRELRSLIRPRRFRPDQSRDIFLASYPRSGNTWLRAVIYAIETGSPPNDLRQLDYRVPDAHYRLRIRMAPGQRRFIVKTHAFGTSHSVKFLYVVRHPVDSIESYHRYLQRISGVELPIRQFAQDAAVGRIWPGSWLEHFLSWTHERSQDHVVRYEDLVAAVPLAVERVRKSLDLSPDQDVEGWLAYFSVDKMKELERAGNRPAVEQKGKDWFIAGGTSNENRLAITEVLLKERPEFKTVAERLGYDFQLG